MANRPDDVRPVEHRGGRPARRPLSRQPAVRRILRQRRRVARGLEGPSLDAMERGLNHANSLEKTLIIALSCIFSLALAATVYYRRRMVRDLLRPVTTMHQGVLKLKPANTTTASPSREATSSVNWPAPSTAWQAHCAKVTSR